MLAFTDSVDTSRNRQLGYDTNGNLSSILSSSTSRSFSWDIRNTLTAVYDNTNEIGRYDYDANLQRIWRRTAQESIEYVLDDDFILLEIDTSQQSMRRYHFAHKPLAVSKNSGTNTITSFLHTDGLGSISDVSTINGALVTARQYDAWGRHRNGTTPSAKDLKLGYTGHHHDIETGLTYARARYYDADLGRFISRDSYEGTPADAPSLHRYAYAQANPLRYVDPDGHEVVPAELADGLWQGTTELGRRTINGILWVGEVFSVPLGGAAGEVDRGWNLRLKSDSQIITDRQAAHEAQQEVLGVLARGPTYTALKATEDTVIGIGQPIEQLATTCYGAIASTGPDAAGSFSCGTTVPDAAIAVGSAIALKRTIARGSGFSGSIGESLGIETEAGVTIRIQSQAGSAPVTAVGPRKPNRSIATMMSGGNGSTGNPRRLQASSHFPRESITPDTQSTLTQQTSTSEGLLEKARTARDAKAAELGPLKPPARPAAVTAGYNTETGQVAVGCSGTGLCAEDRVVEALGGDTRKVNFTEAVRPRPNSPYREVPVCERCEAKYGRDQFPPGTKFKSSEEK